MDVINKSFVETILDVENSFGQDWLAAAEPQLKAHIDVFKIFDRPLSIKHIESTFLSFRSTYLTELDIESERYNRLARLYLILLGILQLSANISRHCVHLSKSLHNATSYWTRLQQGRTPLDKYWYIWQPTPLQWLRVWYYDLPSPQKHLKNSLKALEELQALNHVVLGGLAYYIAYRKRENSTNSIRELCSVLLSHLETFTLRFDETVGERMSVERHRFRIPGHQMIKEKEHELFLAEKEGRLEESNWESGAATDRRAQSSDRLLYMRLLSCLPNVERAFKKSQNANTPAFFAPQSRLVRSWGLLLIGTLGSIYSVQKGVTKLHDVAQQLREAKSFVSTFAVDWVITPISNIYKTIRYNNNADMIVTERALQTDVESLSRMVENWNRHRDPSIDPQYIHAIGENAKLGDISSIMRAYEDSISSPIKNAVLGDFLELVLIQVQKQKVDAEKAVIKLDRLLQQNELNFQLFAAIPAISVVWGLWRLLTRETHPFSAVYQEVRLQLREVSILLNRNNNASASIKHRLFGAEQETVELPMSFEQFGMFVVAVTRLCKVAAYLPPDVKDWFAEDLAELADPRYGVQQRLATVARMYGTYGFLSGLAK